ncbi:MAG: Rid family hydrolase [Pirellulaceae bacterium]
MNSAQRGLRRQPASRTRPQRLAWMPSSPCLPPLRPAWLTIVCSRRLAAAGCWPPPLCCPAATRYMSQARLNRATSAKPPACTVASLISTLENLGLKKQDVVQLKCFIMPMSDVAIANQEITAAFQGHTTPPIVYVEWASSETIPIEIELIAAAGKPTRPRRSAIAPHRV